jgi:hypothetical protein
MNRLKNVAIFMLGFLAAASIGGYVPGAADAIKAMKSNTNTGTKWNGTDFVAVKFDTIANYKLANPDPGQAFEIAGPLTLSNPVDTIFSTSPQHNLSIYQQGNTSLIKIDPDANINLTGIVAKPEGTVYYIFNDDADLTGHALSLRKLDAGSATANQFGIDANVTVVPNSTQATIYIGGKWRML